MIITIFGATGMVGKNLVNQALHKGYTVKAFGRNVYTTGFQEHENLQLIQGALFDEAQVLDAVKGSDAVLSVLGGAFNGNDKTRSYGMKIIIEQMQKSALKRIIAIGGSGILNSTNDKLIMDTQDYPVQFLAVGKEHLKAYEKLKSTSLDWTIVCPLEIIDAAVTGLYHTKANFPPEPDNRKINSGDLAMFMLNELLKNEFIKQRVGISN
jgi:hypothetical protein